MLKMMRLTHSSILLKFKSIESQQLCLHDSKLILFFLLFSSLPSRPIVLFFAFFPVTFLSLLPHCLPGQQLVRHSLVGV